MTKKVFFVSLFFLFFCTLFVFSTEEGVFSDFLNINLIKDAEFGSKVVVGRDFTTEEKKMNYDYWLTNVRGVQEGVFQFNQPNFTQFVNTGIKYVIFSSTEGAINVAVTCDPMVRENGTDLIHYSLKFGTASDAPIISSNDLVKPTVLTCNEFNGITTLKWYTLLLKFHKVSYDAAVGGTYVGTVTFEVSTV